MFIENINLYQNMYQKYYFDTIIFIIQNFIVLVSKNIIQNNTERQLATLFMIQSFHLIQYNYQYQNKMYNN